MSDLLNLLLSDDPQTSQQASKLLIVMADSQPNIFIDQFEEIKLIIMSLCCSVNPSFQTISTMIYCITQSIGSNRGLFIEYIVPLLQLSKDIVQSYFSSDLSSIRYHPDIIPVSQLIYQHMTQGYNLTMKTFLLICEIVQFGYLPMNPFHDLILDKMDEITDLVSEAYLSGFDIVPLLRPILSQNIKIATLFLVLCLFLLSKLGNKEGVVTAILSFAASIASYEPYLPIALSYLPVLLLYSTTADEQSFPKMKELIQSNKEGILEALKNERERSLRRTSLFHPENTTYAIHRAQVKVKEQQTLFSKKWIDHWLTLLEEPQILLWSSEQYTNKGGVVYLIAEISSVEFFPEKFAENGHKNIMKLTRGKDVFSISFNSYEEAMQWRNIFKQYNKVVN